MSGFQLAVKSVGLLREDVVALEGRAKRLRSFSLGSLSLGLTAVLASAAAIVLAWRYAPGLRIDKVEVPAEVLALFGAGGDAGTYARFEVALGPLVQIGGVLSAVFVALIGVLAMDRQKIVMGTFTALLMFFLTSMFFGDEGPDLSPQGKLLAEGRATHESIQQVLASKPGAVSSVLQDYVLAQAKVRDAGAGGLSMKQREELLPVLARLRAVAPTEADEAISGAALYAIEKAVSGAVSTDRARDWYRKQEQAADTASAVARYCGWLAALGTVAGLLFWVFSGRLLARAARMREMLAMPARQTLSPRRKVAELAHGPDALPAEVAATSWNRSGLPRVPANRAGLKAGAAWKSGESQKRSALDFVAECDANRWRDDLEGEDSDEGCESDEVRADGD